MFAVVFSSNHLVCSNVFEFSSSKEVSDKLVPCVASILDAIGFFAISTMILQSGPGSFTLCRTIVSFAKGASIARDKLQTFFVSPFATYAEYLSQNQQTEEPMTIAIYSGAASYYCMDLASGVLDNYRTISATEFAQNKSCHHKKFLTESYVFDDSAKLASCQYFSFVKGSQGFVSNYGNLS
jgi:tRNA A37 threonylcarbamoyladenosine modification protein TsaB